MRVIFAGTASQEQLRPALRDPTGMRRFLKQRRKAATSEEQSATWCALFRLYGLPDDNDDWGWPRDIRFELLAARLAAELFPRCQGLLKPHGGGPSEKFQRKKLDRKLKLLKKFDKYRQRNPRLSRIRAAEHFMKDEKNKKACAAAGFTKFKSFAQAMKEIGSETLGS